MCWRPGRRWPVGRPGPETRIEREMGYSMVEFARALPAAMRDWPVKGGPVKGGDGRWVVRDGEGSEIATIEAMPLPDRVAAALRLPVLRVTIDLHGAATAPEFMRRFERGLHRGGG